RPHLLPLSPVPHYLGPIDSSPINPTTEPSSAGAHSPAARPSSTFVEPSGSHAQPASPTDSASSGGSPRSATAPSPPSPASPPSAELVELKAMVAHQLASQQQSIQALQTIIQESNTRMEQRLTEALSQFNFLRHIMPLFAPTPATAI